MSVSRSNNDINAILIIAVITSVNVCGSVVNKYCGLKCSGLQGDVEHTVCERSRQKCGPDVTCGSDFQEIQFSNDDRQYILDIHNYLRNKVALGLEDRNLQPPAANMKVLKYNFELEFIAQCWANTCNGNPLVHDKCRRTDKYEHVGQNLGYANSSVPNINIVKTIKDLILLWYDEVDIFNNTWILDTRDRGVKVGHYTQMMWSSTSEIGCAASFYTKSTSKTYYNLILVCNYGPGGNYIGFPVYEIGYPASNCDNLNPNEFYKGLCGDNKKINIQDKTNFNIFEELL